MIKTDSPLISIDSYCPGVACFCPVFKFSCNEACKICYKRADSLSTIHPDIGRANTLTAKKIKKPSIIMAKLLLLLLVSVFMSFCACNPYQFRDRDHFRPRYYHKRTASEHQLKACVNRINELRAEHNAEALNWNMYVARDAENYAKKLVDTGVIVKDSQEEVSDKEGEIITKVQGGGSLVEKCITAVNRWYSQYDKYVKGGGCNSDNGVKGTEDFTQLVWKLTNKIGIAVDGDIVDARFFPHGNFEYEFSDDVDCYKNTEHG